MAGLVGAGVSAAAVAADGVIEEVVVQGTVSRMPVNLESAPGTVQVITAAEIDEQLKYSNDLAVLLQNTIPGYGAASSGSYSNASQTMRGRKPAVFIDGVPVTIPLRNIGRENRVIAPGAIGRIDVIAGSTSVYGLGAAGGLINFATKEPTEGAPELQTDVGTGFSLTELGGDSLTWSASQSVSGKVDRTSFVLSGFYEDHGLLYDADNHRIPPDPQLQGGIAESKTHSLFGKVGYDLTEAQRLYVTALYYDTEQDPTYVAVPGEFGSDPASAVRGEPSGENQMTEYLMTTLRYVNDQVLGGDLIMSGYYTDYTARFSYFEPPNFPPDGGQSEVLAERWGLRLDMNTPFSVGSRSGSVSWGADFSSDVASQDLVDGRRFVPELEQESLAGFVQVEFGVFDWLQASGGFRYDDASVSGDTFTTINFYDHPCCLGGVTVEGGTLDYSKLTGNFGISVHPFNEGVLSDLSFFAGFSQGYSISDLGRELRSTTAGSIEDFGFEADTVTTYEYGFRGDFDSMDFQISGFHSRGKLGASFSNQLDIVRAPERLWGVELMMHLYPADDWRLGASYGWVDGETRNLVTREWEPLRNDRIAPAKLLAYVEHDVADKWSIRAQFLYSARQNRFPGNPRSFNRTDVEAYALVDLSAGYRVGPGTLTMAVTNALNEQYYPPDAWGPADDLQFTAGSGARLRLSYSVRY